MMFIHQGFMENGVLLQVHGQEGGVGGGVDAKELSLPRMGGRGTGGQDGGAGLGKQDRVFLL